MTEKKDNFILKWHDDSGTFMPIESDADMNEGIFIELVNDSKWRYFYIKGASLISRRTALRAANGISKTGYIHPKTNIRYGIECELKEEISPYEDMPDTLRKSQRSWYKGEYKQY
ncbi:MAG: hypothetical protein ACFFCE_06415 [Promethearchaeota archaeon]